MDAGQPKPYKSTLSKSGGGDGIKKMKGHDAVFNKTKPRLEAARSLNHNPKPLVITQELLLPPPQVPLWAPVHL